MTPNRQLPAPNHANDMDSLFLSRSSLLALETRTLFDGAGAVVADKVAETSSASEHHDTPADIQPRTIADADKATPHEQQAAPRNEVLFVDSGVEGWQSIVANVRPGVDVVMLDASKDPLQQIADRLSSGEPVDAVHIVSHGTPGALQISGVSIDLAALDGYSGKLAEIGSHITQDGDILLYGCDIGAGAGGEQFLAALARATSADIAASSDATGAADKGGDWVLERNNGSIEVDLALSERGMEAYAALLAVPAVTEASDLTIDVPEDATGTLIGTGITVSGTGVDQLTVTASVGAGTLGQTSFTGDAAAVNAWISGLTYTYTGTSETGATDTLTLSIQNITDPASPAPITFTRDINITPQNDVPTIDLPGQGETGRLSVAEGGSVSFVSATGTGTAGSPVIQVNLGLVDPDNSSNQIIIKITSLPEQGVLKLGNNELTIGSTFALSDIDKLSYHHNGQQVLATGTTDGFTVTVDDGSGGLVTGNTITLDLTPVNNTPSASGTITLIEGEAGVALTGGIVPALNIPRGDLGIADPDDGSHTITVTQVPARGQLFYGGVLVTNGQVIANADLSKFTYTHDGEEPAPDVNGYGDQFKITVTDAGGGTGTPATTAEQTINLIVLPNNDDPELENNKGVVFGPDAGPDAPSDDSMVTISTDMLHVVDADSPDSQLTYTLTSIPDISKGYLTNTSDPDGKALPVGYSFTQADIDSGLIQYVSLVGGDYTTDFRFTVRDGGIRIIPGQRDGGIYESDDASADLAIHTFTIEYQSTVDPNNGVPGMAPDFAKPNEPGGTLELTLDEIAEGQEVKITQTHLETIDTDNPPEELVYRLHSLPSNGTLLLNGAALTMGSTFTQADINAGNVSFRHNGGEDFTSTFTFDVSDGSSTTAVTTFNIDVKPQNDTPSAATSDIKVGESGTVVINSGATKHIVLSDADNMPGSDKTDGYAKDNSLSFRVTVLPTHGTLYLNGVAQIAANFIVTQAELDGGKLEYRHDGSEPTADINGYTDRFTIEPVDDQNVTVAGSGTGLPATDPTNQVSTGDAKVINIVVNPINDAPVFVSKKEPVGADAIYEGDSVVIKGNGAGAGEAALVYTDADNSSTQRQYRITTPPVNGQLLLRGVALGANSVFTQADLDGGWITYRHNGSETSSDKFSYVVSDGDYTANEGGSFEQGVTPISSDFHIGIKPANDIPTLNVPSTLDVTASGTGYVNVGTITVGDVDLDATTTGEVDFLRVEVKWTDAGGALVAGAMINYTGADPATSGAESRGYIYGKGTNSLIIQGTKAEVQAILNSLQVANSADRDATNDKLVIIVDDRLYTNTGTLDPSGAANGGDKNQGTGAQQDINGTNNRVTKEITLVASNVNDVPTISNSNTGYSVDEDGTVMLGGYTLGDADSFGRDVTVVVELFGPDNTTLANTTTEGRLQLGATTGLTSSSGNNGNTITLTGSMSEVQNALNALKVQARNDFNNGPFHVKVSFTDFEHAGEKHTVEISREVTIVPVNDAPVLTVPGNQVMDSGTHIDITTGFGVQDTKDISQGAADYIEVTVTATGGGAGDQISIQAPGAATVVGDNSLTVVVKGMNAEVAAALNSLRYTPANPNIDQIITISVSADDKGTDGKGNGTEGTGKDGNNTDTDSFTITISGTNDAPVVTAPASVSVVEDTSGNTIAGISYADTDDFGGIQQITLGITHGTLDLASKTGLTLVAGAYGSTTITIEGTKAALNAALATLTYKPTADYHGGAVLTVTANDKGLLGTGGEQTDTKTVNITVTPINDRPTAGTDVILTSVAEDATSPSYKVSDLVFGYSDATDNQSSNGGGTTETGFSYVAIVGNAATAAQGEWQISDGSGGWITIPASGLASGSALIFESSREVRFVPKADFNGEPGKLTVRLADGSVNLAMAGKISADAATRFDISQAANGGTGITGAWNNADRTIAITVTPVNDAPTRTADTVTSLVVTEDATSPAGSMVGDLFGSVFSDAKDAVAGGSSANNLAGIAITGNAATSSQGIWQYSTDDGASWTAIAGVSDTNALILKATDQLRFLPNALNYNGPADPLTVRLIDSSNTAVTSGDRIDVSGLKSGGTTAYSNAANAVTLAAVVNPGNDAPTMTHTAKNPTVTENGTAGSGTSIDPVTLLNPGTVADIDLSTTLGLDTGVFGAGSITVTLTDGIAGDVLQIGALDGIASTSGGSGNTPLVITLKGDATLAQVDAILAAIQYKSTSDNPTSFGTDTSRSYTVVLSDGNNTQLGGNAGGPGALAAVTVNGTITIVATNDPPVAVDDTHTVTENASTPITGNVITGVGSPNTTPDSDPDHTTTDLTISGIRTGTEGAVGAMTDVVDGTDTVIAGKYGTLTVKADGGYSYALDNGNPAVNALKTGESLTDEVFSYTLRDPVGSADVAQLTITIHGVTDGPPTVTPVDSNDDGATTVTGQVTVYESALVSGGPTGESASANGTINLTAPDGLASITIGTTVISVAQLNDLAANPIVITSAGKGTLTLTGFTSTGDATAPTSGTLSYTYTLTDVQNGTPSSNGASETIDSFALVVTDKTATPGIAASGTLTIRIVDDAPTAKNDQASVTEGTTTAPSTVSGNVVAGGATGDVADRIGADTNTAPVTGIAFGATAGTVGSALGGAYGSLTLNDDGSYTYSLDNTNTAVNALKTNETLTETFTYTITDGDGDTSTATLTITIKGATDGAPTVTPVDTNDDGATTVTGQVTVYESALVSGGPTGESASANGTINLTAPDGLASITIGTTVISVAQLNDLAANPIVITSAGKGTLTLTGFTSTGDATAPTSGTLSYTYTLTDAQNGTPSSNGASEAIDSFALVVTDKTATPGITASGTLTIRIVDDAPTAKNDQGSVTEGTTTAPSTVSGNVVAGGATGDVADRIGADTNTAPVTGVAFGATAGTVGNALGGAYGSLTLNDDGSYTYSLDNTNTVVNALKTGETLTETFTYTITDGDGDTSTATLTITIKGATDGAPTVTPVDTNDDGATTVTGQVTVYESALVSGGPTGESKSADGTITLTAPDGLSKVSIGGREFTVAQLADLAANNVTLSTGKGTLTLTGFTGTGDATAPTSGTLSYTYTLTHAQTGVASNGASETTDSFDLIVTDKTSTSEVSATGKLVVRIVDDAPTAKNDEASVTEGTTTAPSTVSGNVVAGSATGDVADRIGADANTAPVTGVVFGVETGTIGTALDGAYGSLTLNADGSYTYSLDNTNTVVNALKSGDSLTEVFTYTITDGDGDTSTATLTITINGTTDGVLAITPVDGNGGADGHVTVREAGLIDVADTSETNTGSINVSVPDGLVSIDVGGTTVDLAQLNDLGSTPITIATPQGEITLTGFEVTATVGGVPTAGKLIYSYTLIQVQNTPGVDSNTESISLNILDAGAGTATGTLTVHIVDDAPAANVDVNAVKEDSGIPATGNVFTNDRIGADGAAVPGPVTGLAHGGTPGTVGAALDGAYGALTLNADGSYSYVLDSANPAVDALSLGDTLTETFTYTITDGDGDTSTATLTITINGTNDTPTAVGKLDDVRQNDSTLVKVPTAGGFEDIDTNDVLTYTASNLPPGLTIDKDTGEITGKLTPDASQGGPGKNGVYLITVTVDDGKGGTVSQTFTFTVDNPPPVANPDTGAVNADDTLTNGPGTGVISGSVSGVGKDVDIDGDTITVTGVITGKASDAGSVGMGNVGSGLVGGYGTLVLNADGSYSYSADQPASKTLKVGETATDVFTYAISDGEGGVSFTTLTITVTGISRAMPTPPGSEPSPSVYDTSTQAGIARQSRLVTDPPSIWQEYMRDHRVMNLRFPLHPIVYVEVTVQAEQALREFSDMRSMGVDIEGVMPREPSLSGNSRDLGFDPTVFVKPAVDLAQHEQLLNRFRTLGRDGIVSLSADNLLGNDSIFALDKGLHLGQGDQGKAQHKPGSEPAQPRTQDKPRGANSFTSQLKQAAFARPIALAERGAAHTGLPARAANLFLSSN
ncbi:VCBS domain-containing protein [Eoetvoesiella caeni]